MSPRPSRVNSMPLEPFQEAAQGADISIVAVRLDWFNRKGNPDVDRVRRTLGLKADYSRGYRYVNKRISLDMAERLCRALDKDPWEMGL